MYWHPYERERDADPTFGMIGTERLTALDIVKLELARAKGALEFLKAKVGNDRMRELLADEIRVSADRTAAWGPDRPPRRFTPSS